MKTNFIDKNGNYYIGKTRAEALAECSPDPRPGLRPQSRWTRDEHAFFYENELGKIEYNACQVCGKKVLCVNNDAMNAWCGCG